ncbi:hypothetical protein BDD12DRAFT_727623 [Trichophaea hybrida]|nr:hypothetical protein BDD12DRAFT_727623 [Trichophaea hybrida]
MLYLLLCLLNLPHTLALYQQQQQHPLITHPPKHNHIISFGDSYTDTSFDPFTSPLPCASCPLGSPSCLTGDCYTGGHNWLSALTTLSNRSLTITHNFARSGDVVDSDLVQRKSIKSRQMPEMRAVWRPREDSGRRVLWSVFIGINDIGATYDSDESQMPDDPEFLERVYRSLFGILQGLYDDFEAREFLLLNVPDTTRTPYYLEELDEDGRKCVYAAVVGANRKLLEKAEEFTERNDGVKIFYWDSFKEYNKILDEPRKYGFVDETTVCGGDECIWKDSYHPGEAAQKIFGESVAKMLEVNGWW